MTILLGEDFTLISMVKADLQTIYSANDGMFERAFTRNPSPCTRDGCRWHLDFKKGMSNASLNINGFRCHFAEIQLLLANLDIHVLALTETKLDPEHPKELTVIMGYEREQRVRTCRGDVLSICVRDSIKYTQPCDLLENNLELIFDEIIPPQSRPFLIVDW